MISRSPSDPGGTGKGLKLYDEQGRFLYKGRKLGICPACDKKDFTYDVGALGPSMRFCKECIKKTGATALRRDANVSLQNAKNAVRTSEQQIADMQKRYQERFGARLEWNLPQVKKG